MGYGFGYGFDLMETVFPSLFVLVFLLIFGLILVSAVRGIREWSRNNRAPRLTVDAKVVTKRTSVHRGAGEHDMTSTTWDATFQVESGDRLEFSMAGSEYGMLAEGDRGRLSFQGTRYLGFERMDSGPEQA